MTDWQELPLDAGLGVLAGFITSALGGPINVTIVNESARSGFLRAFLIAAGAVLMETIYCVVSFAGFSSLFLSHTVLRGRYVIRVAIGNLRTGRSHLDRAWQLLRTAGGTP